MLQMMPMLEAQTQRLMKDHIETPMSQALCYGCTLEDLPAVLLRVLLSGDVKIEGVDPRQVLGVIFKRAFVYAVVRPKTAAAEDAKVLA
jgi:hypothetical protein